MTRLAISRNREMVLQETLLSWELEQSALIRLLEGQHF